MNRVKSNNNKSKKKTLILIILVIIIIIIIIIIILITSRCGTKCLVYEHNILDDIINKQRHERKKCI